MFCAEHLHSQETASCGTICLCLYFAWQWKYDYLTATYFLLLEKKMKGRPVRLLHRPAVSRNTPNPKVGIFDEKYTQVGIFGEKYTQSKGRYFLREMHPVKW